jgi:hypothetical protein
LSAVKKNQILLIVNTTNTESSFFLGLVKFLNCLLFSIASTTSIQHLSGPQPAFGVLSGILDTDLCV